MRSFLISAPGSSRSCCARNRTWQSSISPQPDPVADFESIGAFFPGMAQVVRLLMHAYEPDAAALTRSAPAFTLRASTSACSRKAARALELMLFDGVDDARPSAVIPLDPTSNRTYHYWHVFVPGVQVGQIYGYRAFGPFEPQRGLRFDPAKLLLDPYGKAVALPEGYSRINASLPGDNCATAMKSVVADPARYDWEGDAPLSRPFSQTVIYEMHVGGFTRHASSGLAPELRGTYRGLASMSCSTTPRKATVQARRCAFAGWRTQRITLDKHGDIPRFTRLLLLMRSRGDLARGKLILNLNEILRRARVEWHGVKLRCPDWSDESHSLAFTVGTLDGRFLVHGMVNAYWEPLTFELPPAPGVHQGWRRAFDTFLEPPQDICDSPDAAPVADETYEVQPRSLVLLFAGRLPGIGQGVPLPQ